MVSSKESFTSLDISGGPSIHMGDDSHIPIVEKGSIKIKHGEFQNVLYVPSMKTNLLYVYQMTHTCSPKRVTFDPDTVDISKVSIGNLIVKGVANHAFKAYGFSHFLPNSYPSALLTHDNNTRNLWHEIFGHLNFKYLQKLHNENMVEGFPLIKYYEGVCTGFFVGKHPE